MIQLKFILTGLNYRVNQMKIAQNISIGNTIEFTEKLVKTTPQPAGGAAADYSFNVAVSLLSEKIILEGLPK